MARLPGSVKPSIPVGSSFAGPRDEQLHQRLADAHAPTLGLDVEIVDDGERPVVAEMFEMGHGVADDGVVDRAGQHEVNIVGEGRGERRVERFGPSLAARPQRPAALRAQLLDRPCGPVR